MEEMFKRKRENVEETTGEEVFRTSKKTLRSLDRGEGGEREEIGEIMKRWREEMEDVMKELRSVKDWREDLRKMKEEVKEGMKEQGSVKKGGEENEERV